MEPEERKDSEVDHPSDSTINPGGSTTEMYTQAQTQRPVRQIGAVFDEQASAVLDGRRGNTSESVPIGSGFVSSGDIITDPEEYQRVLDDLRAQYDNEDN